MPAAPTTAVASASSSASASLQASLAARFALPADSHLVPELESLLRIYPSLDANELFFKWEALSLSNAKPSPSGVSRPLDLTQATLPLLRDLCQREWDDALNAKRAAHSANPLLPPGSSSSLSSSAAATPMRKQSGVPNTPMSAALGGSAKRGGIGGLLGIHQPSTPSPFQRGSSSSSKAAPAGGYPARGSTSASTPTVVDGAFRTPSRPARPSAAGPSRADAHASSPMEGVEPGPSPSAAAPADDSLGAPQVVETLNPHLAALAPSKSSSGATNRVSLAVGTDPKQWNYRYMFERGGQKGEALDDRIDEVTSVLLQTYGLQPEELADPSVASQESVLVVGRICPALRPSGESDAPVGGAAADGDAAATPAAREAGFPRLTSANLVLETSKLVGSGSRTRLHFPPDVRVRPMRLGGGAATAAEVPHPAAQGGQLGLFPGMIVGLYGKNVDGGKDSSFKVEEVLLPPALPLSSTPASELLYGQHDAAKLGGEPLGVVVAAGPFTHDDDLSFAPWHRLLDEVERMGARGCAPDVLLLLGPFLPISHPSLLAPGQELLPAEIFRRHISSRLARLGESCRRTSAILIPSTRDAASGHAAWPQPMLNKADPELGLPKRVKCLPNPCLFSVNEVVFGVSTADVLRDARAEEVVVGVRRPVALGTAAGEGAADPIARACRHVLHQRSFYPLFPASTASRLPLDVTHSSLARLTDVTPDVLVLPSVLRGFARTVDSCVVVNPASVAKGRSDGGGGAGGFARLCVHPIAADSLRDAAAGARGGEDEALEPNRVYERARVDIVRL